MSLWTGRFKERNKVYFTFKNVKKTILGIFVFGNLTRDNVFLIFFRH